MLKTMKTMRILVAFVATFWIQKAAAADPNVVSLITSGLFEPYGVTVDANQNYFLTDSSHRVFRYVPDTGILTDIAGVQNVQGYSEGPGMLAMFSSPKGIISFQGGLVVADSANHVLRFISNQNNRIPIVSLFAGTPEKSGDVSDGPVLDATFNYPTALVTDGTNIFVADTRNNAVRMIYNLNGTDFIRTISTAVEQPVGLALGWDGSIFVSELRTHSIKRLVLANGLYTPEYLAGSTSGMPGANDSFFGTLAKFNSPFGLSVVNNDPANPWLLVCDYGNQTIRKVFKDPDLSAFFGSNVWTVSTYAGLTGVPGMVDGKPTVARFNGPINAIDLSLPGEIKLLVVDSANHAIRQIQAGESKPPVSAPIVGVVTIVLDKDSGKNLFKLVPLTAQETFNNEVVIAIAAEAKTDAYYSFDGQPPVVGFNGYPAPYFEDGAEATAMPASLVDSGKATNGVLTITAVGQADGRRPSSLVESRIQYQVASPSVQGDNAASFSLYCSTLGAKVYFVPVPLDYANKVTNIFTQFPADWLRGPYMNSESLSTNITSDLKIWVQARKDNFIDSDPIPKTFFFNRIQANQISLGFDPGIEASSAFVGMPGQNFMAPVALTLLGGSEKMYSLQFNLSVTNLNGAPPVDSNLLGFSSLLLKKIDSAYFIIPPAMYNSASGNYSSLISSNGNLLAVGWLERAGSTNLYDTRSQDLITYSIAQDRMFLSATDQKVVVGSFKFKVPFTAVEGQSYQVKIGLPSATSDGISKDAYIDAPYAGTNKPLAVRNLAIAYTNYIVGDVRGFRWYNAGDFGDRDLRNNDVMETFQSAVYGLNTPVLNSDFFDAMDSSDGSGALNGPVVNIDNIVSGDGQLAIDDIYVTFRRSLDPSLKWVARTYTNGARTWFYINSPLAGRMESRPASKAIRKSSFTPPNQPLNPQAESFVKIYAEDFQVQPGKEILVPIHARIQGSLPLKVLMFNLEVEPLDNAPALSKDIVFNPTPGLGNPTYSMSKNLGNYAAVWLDDSIAGLLGDSILGTLSLAIPASASEAANYRVAIKYFSGSPNGLGLFPTDISPGLISLGDRLKSSWKDGIPDSWRLRYFGSLGNLLGDAQADADGDGVPNWAEFKAGTNPSDWKSTLKLHSLRTKLPTGTQGVKLRWPSVEGKVYVIERTDSLSDPNWKPLASNLIGTGSSMEFVDNNPYSGLYYRVRLAE